jgi:hypothetical protein
MSADTTTVVVAILGVAGTLSSPLMTQWIAARTKQQEFNLQRQQRLEEREEMQRRAVLEERRSIYAALHTAARQYTQQLRAYLRMLAAGSVTADGRSELEKARQAYRDLYSEAQMILPDRVAEAAISLNEGLGRAYGVIRQLETGHDRVANVDGQARTIEEMQEYCRDTLYDLIGGLRQLMREDLGVAGSHN